MKEAKLRLDEWAKFSPPLAYIAECLKQVMTAEIAEWIMRPDKTAKGMWDYIRDQAKKQRNKGAEGVLVTPAEMQEYIYAYLRDDAPAQAEPMAGDAAPVSEENEAPEGQMSLMDDFKTADDGQMTLI